VSLDSLNGCDIHRLENIITMDNNKHDMFDRLLIWFEATVSRSPQSGKVGLEFDSLTRGYRINTESTPENPIIFQTLQIPSRSRVIALYFRCRLQSISVCMLHVPRWLTYLERENT
jgi:hypothetical protein